MTKQEFLQVFEQRLRVGGYTREGILIELKSHLDELDPKVDIAQAMGDPKKLARAYNVRHLGPFRGVTWMFLTPFIAWFLLIGVWSRLHNGRVIDGLGTLGQLSPWEMWWDSVGRIVIPILVVAILGWLVVHVLARLLKPWRTYIALLILTVAVGTTFFALLEYQSRSGMLDMNKLRLEMNNYSQTGPTFYDVATGRPVGEAEFGHYTVPVNAVAVVMPALLMNLVLAGAFVLVSFPYIVSRRKQMGFTEKYRTV